MPAIAIGVSRVPSRAWRAPTGQPSRNRAARTFDAGHTPVTGCVLGFDYGTRRIGVAAGNPISGTAQPLAVIAARDGRPDWDRIDGLLAEWRPDALVVGLPLTRDGGEQAMTRAARAFADALAVRVKRPVHMVDERHTSQEAARRFAARRGAGAARRRDAANIDSLAAVVILESWLAETRDG